MSSEYSKSGKSKELEVYQERYLLSVDDALAILKAKYGSNFLAVENGEFKIQEWQATKKLEHPVCFGIKPEDYGFSQDQAKEINAKGGIVVYVRKGNKLPSLDLIRAYQNAIKNFCEDRHQSDRNDKSTFRGEPSITFFNQETRQVVIFDRETKIFITAYKLAEPSVDEYLTTGNIGSN
jgi:Colicin D